MLTISGCRGKRISDGYTNFEQFVVIKTLPKTGDTIVYEVYDKDTFVMYYLFESASYSSARLVYSLCPMYGTNGKIAIYAWSNPN
jgi:hypothetical protein